MEGGQKRVIPLDSELDVKSSDQLVPVDRPKFQHNRQRFQGSTLPTSLRFEHNGVAAGWDVYEFEVNYITVETDPAKFTVMCQQINSNPSYVFRLRIGTTTYAMVYWNGEDVVKAGDLEITHGEGEDFATVTLKGDNDGHELELTIDMVSGDFSYDEADWYLIESNYLDATALNGQTDISVLDLTNWVEFNAAVVPPQDAVYSDKKIASYYSCVEQDDGTHLHTWSDSAWTITYCPETDTVLVNGEEAEHSFNGDNGQLAITYNTEYSGVIDVKVIGEVCYFQIYGISANQVQKYVTSAATGEEDFEYWSVRTESNSVLYPMASCPCVVIAGFIPFWSGLRIAFSSSSSADSISEMEMSLSDGTDSDALSSASKILSYSVWFLSGQDIKFYESSVGGVDVTLFEGDSQLSTSDAIYESSNTFGSRTDVYGRLTLCACVFNRVRILEEEDGSQVDYDYEYPFSAGLGDTGSLEYNNDTDSGERRASWFGGGTFTAYDGNSYDFEAGFYVPMERRADDDVYVLEGKKTSGAVSGYLAFPSDWPSDIVTGYEGSFIHYEAYNALLEEHADELVEAEYDTTPLTKADASYWYCTDAAWDISSDYVGDYHDDHYADSDVINDSSAVQSEVTGYDGDSGTDVYSSVSYSGCMRLGEPYAFYDIDMETGTWPGTRYSWVNARSNSAAGQAAIDALLRLSFDTYSDLDTEMTYYFGSGFASGSNGLYLQPYFRSTESGSDSRELVNHSENTGSSSSSSSSKYEATIISGLLSGLKIAYGTSNSGYTEGTVYGDEIKEYWYKLYTWNSIKSAAKSNVLSARDTKEQELISAGYSQISFSGPYVRTRRGDKSWGDTSGIAYKRAQAYYTYSCYTTVTQSCTLSSSAGTLWTSTTGSISEEDVTDVFQTSWGISPVYASIYGTGFSETSKALAGVVSATVCIVACFKGKFQYELTAGSVAEGELEAFTEDNLASLVTLSKSTNLLSQTGLYIDRDISSDSDSGELVTYLGYDSVELHLKEMSIDSSGFTAKLYFTPKFDGSEYGSFYVHRAVVSGETCYVPGHIFDGSLASVSTGKNLVATALGYTYATSQITFTVEGDTVPFFKADSVELSWPSSSGTHDFYSDTLPSAIKALAFGYVYFGSVSNSYGAASAGENINLYFGGEDSDRLVQLRVLFSQADGTGTTTVTQTAGTDAMDFNGHDFTFSINKAEWGESGQEVSLRVTVPLAYEIAARLPYQYNYDTLEYDEESGLYIVNGDTETPLEAVPVGSLAIGFDPTTMQYKFITTTDDPYTYYFLKNTGEFKYGVEKFESTQVGEARCAAIEGFEYLEYSFILEGAYRTYKCTVVSFDEENITVDYEGTRYTFAYSELMTDEKPNEMNFMYTDTRDDKAIPDTVTFARQNFEREFQFLRQTWETTNAVENYWWVDEETMLELNKTSLTVKKKKIFDDYAEEATVDDWGGDFWEDVASFPRYEYLDNTVARYGVTNAYGGEERPRFWTIKEVSSTKLKITFYSLEETDYGTYTDYALEGVSTTVTLNQVEIGTVLNNPSYDRMNTYSQLSVESIIYDSQFSSTVIGQHILFGIHNDNNFNQWALDISTTGELLQVVQGYGFVGVNGCLTGGEIPSAWFDPSIGFTGTVQPIDVIEQEEAIDVTTPEEFTAIDCGDIVVGDESQQWYISKKISSIVSHLLWDEETEMWGTEVLYLNNNVEQVYGSASFGANVLSENGLNYHNFFTELAEHIDCTGLSDIMNTVGKIGTCYFLYYSPRLTTMLYLQQTMGQYAYVHYNTTSPNKQLDQGRVNLNREASEKWYGKEGIKGEGYNASGTRVEDPGENWVEPATPNNEDDFPFNMHTIRQQLYVDNCWAGVGFALMYLLIQAGMSLSDSLSGFVDTKLSGKGWKDSAKSAVKQFGQLASQNALNITSLDMGVLGNLPTQNSAVTGVLTLDMFYSTSEGQAIQAGPGFVQHNFQAQCVAQSATSNQMELKQIGAFISLSELGTLAYKVTELALRYIADAAVGGAAILASGGDQYGVMGAAAAATAVIALGTKYVIQILLDICEVVDKLFHAIASNVPPAQALNMRSNHAFDMEGKHKYGQKSEIFMWPCWGVNRPIEYENESVEAVCQNVPWRLSVPTGAGGEIGGGDPEASGSVLGLDADSVTYSVGSDITLKFSGDVPYMAASCKGKTETTQCPENMAAIIGCESFLPPIPFRNEGVGVREPQFVEQIIQDYMIDEEWELSMTCSRGMISWVSCRDTKLINGAPSNVVIYGDFCGVASPYTAIEIKRGYEQKYMRAWAVTPMAVGVNQSGLNAAYEEKAYHAFDGYGGRIVKWCGSAGMNKEGVVHQYAFIANDRFKRSNMVGANTLYGNFGGEPILALRTIGEDEVYNNVERDTRERMGFVGIPGEDKDTLRYAMPVFAETVSVLPAVMKTISSFNLAVVDGITGLVSSNVDAQSRYKAPVSIDFAIGHKKYRFTDEYINELEVDPIYGVTSLKELVPTLGLTYLGATPYEAYLYSSATRQYYTYAGGTSLNAVDTIERFRDVIYGRYDFVNQEVVLPCVATFDRLDKHVHDDEDERDNTMVPRLKDGKFVGEVWPPIETIWNMRSSFRTISLPSGICFQGPNRCIINRFVYSGYMKNQIIENRGQWLKVPRERYHPFRVYEDEYVKVDENVLIQIVGWTHNPFLLVTSPLGVNSETDCLFEWEITFAWPVEMDDLYSAGQYLVVNVMAETFTPGGKVIPERPAHVFLTRDLFTRTGNYGYYSYRYQSRCGAGNRERLHIWSDQYICVSSLQLEYKPITQKRTEILTQAVDVQFLEEP